MNEQIKAGADIHAGDGGYSEGTQEGYDAFVKVRNKSLVQGRIRDLAEQAGWDYSKIERRNQTENFDEQKFAELIVKECMSQIEEVRQIKAGTAGPVYTQGFEDGMFVAIRTIEEHFGVEE